MEIFFDLAIILVLAAFCGTLFYLFKQPTIVGFIFAGIVIGYFGFLGEGVDHEFIESFSSIGAALLLFIVGLEMRLGDLREVGKYAAIAGVAQVSMTFGAVYLVAPLFGLSGLPVFYIGAALAFSSTVVVVKLLSEKKDINSLYGRLAIGILLVQDVLAILILIFLAGLSQGQNVGLDFIMTILKGGTFFFLAVVASRLVPKFLHFIGRSPELLYLFSLSWAVGVSAFFASPMIGLSAEIGGFLAGLALANSSEHFQIAAKMKPLRDFFLILLFIGLGANMLTGGGVELAPQVIVFSLIVLIGNPIMVALALGAVGYRARTSFLTGFTTSQISEFSFIVIFLGSRLGHIGADHVSVIAMVGIVTIFISSYLIIYGSNVYERMRPFMKKFEFRKKLIEEKIEETNLEDHVVLVGVHRMGQSIVRSLSNTPLDFVAVDFDPRVVERLREIDIPVIYGDITDSEIQELVGLQKARVLISTVPDHNDNLSILETVKKENPDIKTLIAAQTEHDAHILYNAGADYVILPHFIGGTEIANLISSDPNLDNLEERRERDREFIGSRL